MPNQIRALWALMCITISSYCCRSDNVEECEDEVSLLQSMTSGRSIISSTGNEQERLSMPSKSSVLANEPTSSSGIGKCPREYEEQQAFKYTKELQERPIKEILQEHPGIDGFCLASGLWPYWRYCSDSRQKRDYNYGMQQYDRNIKRIIQENHKPVTIQFDGGSVTTIDAYHTEDDLVCATNGFYDIPREKALHDFDYVNSMSEKHCKWLSEVIPDYENISMDWFNRQENFDDAALRRVMNGLSPMTEKYSERLKYKMLKHEAVKCLLGGPSGVGCDIVFCARRGCMEPNGVVKYGLNATC